MTAKEKAEELVLKMYAVRSNSVSDITLHFSKQCALIAVDEIVKELRDIAFNYDIENLPFLYWQEIKYEIEKL